MAKAIRPSDAATVPSNKKKEKKEKKVRVFYPGLNVDAEGKATTQLTEWPVDYDKSIHKPLRKLDFTTDAPFLRRKAEFFAKKAEEYRKLADAAASGVGREDQKKVAKLLKMQAVMSELVKELGSEGIDLTQFLNQ